jgi:hypothetical protein
MIYTQDLIFGSTAFGQNNYKQALPIAIDELPASLYRQFGPLLWCKQLQFSQIAVSRSLHRFLMGFRWTHCWPLQRTV